MKCIYCGRGSARVVDSRPVADGSAIRRRRECTACGGRFTTYEQIEAAPLAVLKRNGTRESFDCEKVRKSILAACGKRTAKSGLPEAAAKAAEQILLSLRTAEVSSEQIAGVVLSELLKRNPAAYIRFASVHDEFRSADDFAELLGRIAQEDPERRPE